MNSVYKGIADQTNFHVEEKSSRTFHYSLFFSFFLLAFMITVILLLVSISTRRFSSFSREKQTSQISILINEEKEHLNNLSLEYGWWNDTIEYVIYKRDMEWAEDNIGQCLVDHYGLSWGLVYDLGGNLIYGRDKEKSIDSFPLSGFGENIQLLIKETLESGISAPMASAGFMNINEELHLVSVIVLAAYEPTELEVEHPHGFLVLTHPVNREMLSSFSSMSGISRIELTVDSEITAEIDSRINEQVTIQDPNGRKIGVLYWSKDDAVKDFIGFFLYFSIFGIVIMTLLSLFFYRNLTKYKKLTNRIIHTEKNSIEKLSYHANYDELTGLANRHLFLDRLDQAIKRSLRSQSCSAMLFIDLDGFKNINDTLGHDCGDELLILFGKKLQELVRKQDTVSRFGGDEFCILLEDVGNGMNADRVLSKIQDIFDQPFFLRGEQLYISASIGVVLIPDDGMDTVSLLRFSDIAMYQAKRMGNIHYHYYSPELDKKAHRRAIIRNGLRKAIVNEELSLNYQPIYDLKSKSLEYVEALLRWNSPESGNISPEDFIPIAEETGMIREIGFWIIEKSINDILEINSAINCTVRLSINISVNQLRDPDFLEKFLFLVDKFDVDHSVIQLEITENLLIDDSIYQNEILVKLSELGFKLVMDDFGTGYSSLSYINNIPLKTIKIDKSFVSILDKNENNGAMIRTIVFMAAAYGLNTVAEGIETREQEEFLLSTGCRYGQGFLYCCPVTKDEIIKRIDNKSMTVFKSIGGMRGLANSPG